MTVMDKVNAETRNLVNSVFDKEPLNYLEAASLYGTIAQGRHNLASLEVLYNHCQDNDLRELIDEALEVHTEGVVEQAEDLLEASGGTLPKLHFAPRSLHKEGLEIPADGRLTDAEIAIAVGTMAKASQTALLASLHQSYQLEVALMYRKMLDAGLDWDYRLLQLMLKRGWLPHVAKIEH